MRSEAALSKRLYDRLFVLQQTKACILILTSTGVSSSSSSAKIPISLGEFTVNPVFLCAFCTDICGGPHGLGYHAHWGSLTASPKGTADWTRNFDLPDQIFPTAFYRFWARRPAGFEPTTAAL
jgi:hypothetical protein